ncbi:hypothetical protein WJX74_003406 [Apatococcus lobatus]|uniref:Vesicle tethering protein Uso1/P115-like head domain-containing protein n=1 Tax=Apatococcus lobatus TaxID=904363 RepID=A0AAW1RD16_9CHLO
MNFLGAVGRTARNALRTAEGSEDDKLVAQLLARVADKEQVEDRKEALTQLCETVSRSEQAQLALGSSGFLQLCAIVQYEQADTEMVQGSLEALVLSMARRPRTKGQNPAAINAELFARAHGNVQLVMGLLKAGQQMQNPHIRLHAVRLLAAIAGTGTPRLSEAILTSPQGVATLMDLLNDTEAIRNEALLLMTALATTSSEIQKNAASEGAFQRLFGIVRDEGGADGGIVVQDCMQLLNNLLQDHQGNQLLFREMGYLQSLPAFLKLQGTHAISKQTAANLSCGMLTLHWLIADKKVTSMDTNDLFVAPLLQAGCFEALQMLALPFGGGSPARLRAQALGCLADLVKMSTAAHEKLMSAKVVASRSGAQTMLLHAVLRAALYSDDKDEQHAALALLTAFCQKHAEGQEALAATLLPTTSNPQPGAPRTFGEELMLAWSGRSTTLQVVGRAASISTILLRSSAASKQRFLNLTFQNQVQPDQGSSQAPSVLLMQLCITWLAQTVNAQLAGVRAAPEAPFQLLHMLITWLLDCPPAAMLLASMQGAMSTLTTMARIRVQGKSDLLGEMIAVCLGQCMVATSSQAAPSGGSEMIDLLAEKVGIASYLELVSNLTQRCARSSAISAESPKKEDSSQQASVGEMFMASTGPEFQAAVGRICQQVQEVIIAAFQEPRPNLSVQDMDETGLRQQFTALERQLQQLQRRSHALLLEATSKANIPAAALADSSSQSQHARNHSSDTTQLPVSSKPQADAFRELMQQTAGISNSSRLLSQSIPCLMMLKPPQVGPAPRPDHHGMLSSMPDARVPQLEARAASMERRTAVAEAENSSLQQQLQSLQAQHLALQQRSVSEQTQLKDQLHRSEEKARQAQTSAQQSQTELQALSNAYSDLEAHAFSLEGQLKGTDRSQDRSVEEHIAAAVASMEQEAEETQNDLMVCIGEEQQKVERLSERLQHMGVDVDKLLCEVGDE